ncbi:hypothetical protein ACF0H5_019877 [Mactra antiquata]
MSHENGSNFIKNCSRKVSDLSNDFIDVVEAGMENRDRDACDTNIGDSEHLFKVDELVKGKVNDCSNSLRVVDEEKTTDLTKENYVDEIIEKEPHADDASSIMELKKNHIDGDYERCVEDGIMCECHASKNQNIARSFEKEKKKGFSGDNMNASKNVIKSCTSDANDKIMCECHGIKDGFGNRGDEKQKIKNSVMNANGNQFDSQFTEESVDSTEEKSTLEFNSTFADNMNYLDVDITLPGVLKSIFE